MIDYYQVLEVSRDADQEEIHQAFRRKARKYHPDINKKTNANDKFVQVNEAYQTLSDPMKRTVYNLDWRQAHPTTQTTTKSHSKGTNVRREPASKPPDKDKRRENEEFERCYQRSKYHPPGSEQRPKTAEPGRNHRQANEEFEQFYRGWQYHPPDQEPPPKTKPSASKTKTKTSSKTKSKNPPQSNRNPQAKASSRPRQTQKTRTPPVAKKHFLARASLVMVILVSIPVGAAIGTTFSLLYRVSEGLFVPMSRDFYVIGISLLITAFLLALSYLTS